MSSGWLRVAAGLSKVAQAAVSNGIKESSHVTEAITKHGVDIVGNSKTALSASLQINGDLLQQHVMKQENVTYEYTTSKSELEVGSSKTSVYARMKDADGISVYDRAVSNHYKFHHRSESPKPIHETDSSNHVLKDKSKEPGIPLDTKESMKQTIPIPTPIEPPTTKPYQDSPSYNQEETSTPTYSTLTEGKAVPSTRIGRAAGFAQLGLGLAVGTVYELTSRLLSPSTYSKSSSPSSSSSSALATEANADRLALTLCRMRGAALKLGQMTSIQDETFLPPTMSKALEQVRQGAEAMPLYQLHAQLEQEFSSGWRDKFMNFEELPFAAASIGQVHRAKILQNGVEKDVVVKVQYPGVAESIDADLNNLIMLVKYSGMSPPGLFLDNVINVGRKELKVECQYNIELENQRKFKELVEADDELVQAKFCVPGVISELSTDRILTTEFCRGGTIDKVSNLSQVERDRIGRYILKLTMKELFVWRFMQTDPNWGNFLYDVGTGTTHLIDFGSARGYEKEFVDGYLRIVWASANQEEDTLMKQSRKMGFLTGDENEIMVHAHKMSGYTVGEPFATEGPYDFGQSGITKRLSDHGSHFLQHRLTPPPEEVYTLHRKLAGAFNLCIKLGANVECREMLVDIVRTYNFEDGQDHPLKSS